MKGLLYRIENIDESNRTLSSSFTTPPLPSSLCLKSVFSLCKRRIVSIVLPIKSNRVIPRASTGSAVVAPPASLPPPPPTLSPAADADILRRRALLPLFELESMLSSGSIRDSNDASSSNAFAKSLRRCFSRCLFLSDFFDVDSGSPEAAR